MVNPYNYMIFFIKLVKRSYVHRAALSEKKLYS
jgi:hypothetical protein